MSKQVDERIVEMRFENNKFEKGVSQTLKTIDKLKEKLEFKNAGQGFDLLQKKADSMSFEHLVKSVDSMSDFFKNRTGLIGNMFAGLERTIISSFENAFTKVKDMLNQVTLQPITTGFSEYELKTNSVQVIASNTGVLMRDAMASMEETGEALIGGAEALEAAWSIWLTGEYGNGLVRKEALGDSYDTIQRYVNKIVTGEIKMGDAVSDATDALEEQIYTMDDIEKVLDDLNVYADRTIYNYAQMTDAIGQFTVQGVDLYDAASAVQGLANLAAFTGSDANTTARVMREAAKGLATGYINLQDWMSFETSGGMGGKEFQDQLKDTADHLWKVDEAYRAYVIDAVDNSKAKTAIDEETESISAWIDMEGRFRDSLKGGWLNEQVLITTLHKFAGDWNDEMYEALGYTEEEIKNIQALGEVAFEAATKSKTFTQMWDAVTEAAQSSWTTTWEYIFGHFYDARNLWTEVGDVLSDIISSNNEARNEVLRVWSKTGGRRNFFEGITHLFNFIRNIAGEIKGAWNELFPAMSGKKLTKLSGDFNKFAYSLERLNGVYAIAYSLSKSVFSVLKIGKTVVTSFFKVLKPLLGLTDEADLVDNLEIMSYKLSNFIDNFADYDKIGEKSTQFFEVFVENIKNLPMMILTIIYTLDELSKEFLGFSIIDVGKSIFALVPKIFKSIQSGLNILSSLKDKIKDLLPPITELFDKFKIKDFNFANVARLGLGIGQLVLIFETLKTFKSGKGIMETITEIPEKITEMIESFTEAGEGITNFSKSGVMLTVAKSLIMLAVSLGILALIPTDKLKDVTSTMIMIMVGVTVMLKVLGGVLSVIPNASILQAAASMALFSVSIGILVGSIAMLNVLDFNSTINSLIVVGTLMLMIGLLVEQFNHSRFSNNLPKVGVAILAITQAISSIVMVISFLSILTAINADAVWNALGIVTIIFTLIMAFYWIASSVKPVSAKSMAGISLAIFSISSVVTSIIFIISIMSVLEHLGYGITAAALLVFVSVLSMIIICLEIMSLITPGPGLVKASMAITLLTDSIISIMAMLGILSILEHLGYGTTVNSLGVFIAVISVLTVCLEIMSVLPAGKGLVKGTLAILVITIALIEIMGALVTLSMLDFNPEKVKSLLWIIGIVSIIMGALATLAIIFGKTVNITKTFKNKFIFKKGSFNPITTILNSIALVIVSITLSIYLLIASINGLIDAAEKYGNGKDVSVKISNLIKGIADAFANSWSYIADAVDKSGMGDDLERWFKSMLDHLLSMIGYFLYSVIALIGEIVLSINDAIIEVMAVLTGMDLSSNGDIFGIEDGDMYALMEQFVIKSKDAPVNNLINSIVVFLAMVIYGVGDAIINNAAPIALAVDHVLEALLSIALVIAASIFGIFMPEWDEQMLAGWAKEFTENWRNEVEKALEIALRIILVGAFDIVTGIFVGLAWTLVHGITYFINNGIESINESFGTNIKKVDTSWFDDFYNEIYTDIHEWALDVETESDKATQAINSTTESLQNFNNTLESLKNQNVESKVVFNPMFANDTSKLNQDLFTAGDNAGKESIKGFNSAWDINSPSLVGEQSGEYIGEGVVNGISGFFKTPEAQEKLAGIKDTLPEIDWSGLYDPGDSEFDTSITKVFNFNTEKVGDDLMTGSFGNMFSGMTQDIGSTSTDIASVNDAVQNVSDTIASEGGKFYDDRDLLNELAGLRNDVMSLSSAISKIKMYLDTNKLVGEMIVPMDNALAQRTVHSRRGN